jgi:hypothetical protein
MFAGTWGDALVKGQNVFITEEALAFFRDPEECQSIIDWLRKYGEGTAFLTVSRLAQIWYEACLVVSYEVDKSETEDCWTWLFGLGMAHVPALRVRTNIKGISFYINGTEFAPSHNRTGGFAGAATGVAHEDKLDEQKVWSMNAFCILSSSVAPLRKAFEKQPAFKQAMYDVAAAFMSCTLAWWKEESPDIFEFAHREVEGLARVMDWSPTKGNKFHFILPSKIPRLVAFGEEPIALLEQLRLSFIHGVHPRRANFDDRYDHACALLSMVLDDERVSDTRPPMEVVRRRVLTWTSTLVRRFVSWLDAGGVIEA